MADFFYDVGVDLLSGIICIAITVFIIDRIIKRREDKKNAKLLSGVINSIISDYSYIMTYIEHIISYYNNIPLKEDYKSDDGIFELLKINFEKIVTNRNNIIKKMDLFKEMLTIELIEDIFKIDEKLEYDLSVLKGMNNKDVIIFKPDIQVMILSLAELSNLIKEFLRKNPETYKVYFKKDDESLIPLDLNQFKIG